MPENVVSRHPIVPMNPEEKTYIKRILRGETELYGYFLDTYGPRIFTLVQQIVSNREDAEDLTQDIFVKAFESLKSFRGDCQFITWIYRIAYNMTNSALRRSKQRQEFLPADENMPEAADTDDAFDFANETERDERIEDLQLALSWAHGRRARPDYPLLLRQQEHRGLCLHYRTVRSQHKSASTSHT